MQYLEKVPEVKDTVHKQSLLYHLCNIVNEKFPDSTDLYSEFGAVHRASRVCLLRYRRQILLLILSEFEQINLLLAPLKESENHRKLS